MSDTFVPPDSRLSWTVLDQYLAGGCTPRQALAVQQLLAQSSTCTALIEELTTHLRPRTLQPFDTKARWAALKTAIQAESSDATILSTARRRTQRTPRRVSWNISALRAQVVSCVIGAALLFLVGWSLNRSSNENPVAAPYTYATRAGELTAVTLTDGTRVTLAPQTTLTVPRDFGQPHRTVALSGEALFNVRSAQGVPFIVRTGTISTQVLGTTFAVRRYAARDTALVAVQSGKVVATGLGTPVVVTTGSVARMTDSTATVISTDPSPYTNWTKGQLVFDRATVSDVLKIAGRWYGYEFILPDSLLARTQVSVVLKISDPADMMLQLKAVLDVNMTIRGDTILLHPRRAVERSKHKDLFKPLTEMGR